MLAFAAASYGLGAVLTKRAPIARGPMGTASQMLAGGAMLWPASALHGEDLALPGRTTALAVSYLVVFGSLLGYTSFGYLLKNARPALATSYAFVNPMVALAIGATLGGEHFARADMLGLAVVLAAVALVALASREPAPGDRARAPRAMLRQVG